MGDSMEAGGQDVLGRLPWPLMMVRRSGELATNTRLLELLHLDAVAPHDLEQRFEISRPGGHLLTEEELPWRRAAKGETFAEEEIWYDRRTTVRHPLLLRCQPWDEQMVVSLEDLSEHPVLMRNADLVGSVGAALLRARDPAGVAHAIVEDVARALGAQAVFLLEAPPREQRLRLLTSLGLPSAFMVDHETVSFEMPSILAVAARTQTLQEVERIESLPERDFASTRRLLELGLHSSVALPLIADGDLVGVLGLAWRHPGRLDKLERRTTQAVGLACALGLQHVRFRVAERREAERLRTLRDAALAVESALPLGDLLRRLIEQACELTRARYGALGVLNAEGSGLSDFVFAGVSDEVARRIGHLPEGRGLLGAVIHEGRAIRVAELRSDPRSVGFPLHHPTMTSFLGIPLRIGREVFGNFYLCDKDGGEAFTDEDERLLELFGAQSALAVGYARQMQLAEQAHEELDRVHDEFAAIIAHDLRSPVGALLLQLDALLERAKRDEGPSVPLATLERMRRSVSRMAQMTDDLLDVSRIELERLSLDREPLPPGAALQSLVAQLAPVLAGHPVSLAVRGRPAAVLADPARFDQIFTNLLENAAKYSAPGSPIQVVIEEGDHGVTVSIEDRGPGIAAEELPRLFDRFYQAPRARAQKSGLGLGLYIVRGLVEGHGGRIWAESQPGEGSCFHVWLPAADGAVAQMGGEAHPS
jgi:signal transduction histidine kinase